MVFRKLFTWNDSYDSRIVSPRGLVCGDLLLGSTTVSDSSFYYLAAHPLFHPLGFCGPLSPLYGPLCLGRYTVG
jgi:hypothetical protein